MLLATVLLWALNLSVTKYILTHGLLPLSYATRSSDVMQERTVSLSLE